MHLSRSIRVIIVNYRTASLVIDCLRSLQEEVLPFPDCKVIVVENASPDDSVNVLEKAIQQNQWSSWVELLPLKTNGGFGAGNNAAIRHYLAREKVDYFHLLNPDTIARPRLIHTLVEFLESHPHVGMVASRLEEPDGTPQGSAFRFPTLFSQIDEGLRMGIVSRILKKWVVALPASNVPHQADWLTGASLMIRHEVIEEIGLFDEGYFLYFEEVDFCLRARRAGWSCWHVPDSRVIHLEGKSTGISAEQKKLRPMPRYWFESRKRYFLKNYGWVTLFLVNIAFLLSFLVWRIRRRIQRKPDNDPPRFLWDFVRYSFSISSEKSKLVSRT
jgi:N-acetylglucosaminyl-diphospho-decaprenol L-rhamnosyltransferase